MNIPNKHKLLLIIMIAISLTTSFFAYSMYTQNTSIDSEIKKVNDELTNGREQLVKSTSRIDELLNTNKNLLQELESRNSEIRELKQELISFAKQAEKCRDIESKIGPWLKENK